MESVDRSAHRLTGIVGARDVAHRRLAVLMGGNVMDADEVVDVVAMERPSVVELMVAQLIGIFDEGPGVS